MRPSFFEIQELAGKGRLQTADDGVVLIACNLTPPPSLRSPRPAGRAACGLSGEPVRIYSVSIHASLKIAGLPLNRFLATWCDTHAS